MNELMMMMRCRWMVWMCVLAATAGVQAQDGYVPASETQAAEIAARLTDGAAKVKTLQCDFVQRQTVAILAEEMVAEGRMFYKQGGRLRWEYVRPYRYEFVMNGDSVRMGSDGAEGVFNLSRSSVFREISSVMVSGISGAGVLDGRMYAVQFMTGADDDLAVLTPRRKELRAMFDGIRICIDRREGAVKSVMILMTGGDSTLVEMKNRRVNVEIDDEVFSVR